MAGTKAYRMGTTIPRQTELQMKTSTGIILPGELRHQGTVGQKSHWQVDWDFSSFMGCKEQGAPWDIFGRTETDTEDTDNSSGITKI